MSPRVCVVGAGIIGLSTALHVLDTLDDVTVTIVTEHVTPDTTGDGAGGFWQPYLMGDTPLEKSRDWGQRTYHHLLQLSASEVAGDIGVSLQSGVDVYHNVVPDPYWSDIVLGFRHLTTPELRLYPGASYGYGYTTVTCEAKKYLPWLMKRFIEKGGRIAKRKIKNFEELYSECDVVVNCSGLGARELCPDHSVVPIKGQLIKVEAPWIKNFVNADDDDIYVLVNSDYVVLGGTHEMGEYQLHVNEQEKKRIWSKCCQLIPSLKRSRYVADWVGLRPYRPSVRVELETRRCMNKDMKIVHNYGHGGGGITLHWGCAQEAAKLVKQALAGHVSAKL